MSINYPSSHQLPALRALWHEAFGEADEDTDPFFTLIYKSDNCRVIEEDGKVCSALHFLDFEFENKRVAYLYAVATDKAYRGRGYASALIEDTHEILKSRGYAGVLLVPGETALFDFYRRLGYDTTYYISEFTESATGTPVSVRLTDVDEYERERQKHLPEKSFHLSDRSKDYLAATASLYCGDGFVCAAHRTGDALVCAEFLGDTSAAPSLAYALGCTSVRYRCPGSTRPFAMYHALSSLIPPPDAYFPFAFD